MLWHSVSLLTLADLAIVGVSGYLIYVYFRQRVVIHRLGIRGNLLLVMCGSVVLAVVHLADHIVTPAMGAGAHTGTVASPAAAVVLGLGWYAGLAAFAVGFGRLLGHTVPALGRTLDELEGSRRTLESRVTERTREISASERRFRDFAAAGADWYWETDADLRFTRLSDSVRESVGIDPGILIGRSREEVGFGSVSPEEWAAHIGDLAARRPVRDFHYSVNVPGRGRRHFRVSGVPTFDPAGSFLGYRGVGVDVTDAVVAQERAAAAEARLRTAIQCVPDCYAVFDTEDRLVEFNDAYRLLNRGGVGGRLAAGMTYTEIVSAMVRNGALVAARGREADWLEARLLRHRQPPREFVDTELADGRWYQTTESRSDNGDTVLVARDVTELKLREAELVDSEGRLAEANLMLRLVLDAIPSRVFWKDRERRYLGCNASFARGAGVGTPDRVIGLTDADLGWVVGTEVLEREDREVLQGGVALRDIEVHTERGGRSTWVNKSKFPLEGVDGRVVGVLGVVDDITVRREAELEVRSLNEDLERRVRERTAELEAFSYSVSHDLRAPLRHVAGYVDLLVDHAGAMLDETARRHLAVISDSAERMGVLIDDLLELSRTGRVEMSTAPVDLQALAESVRDELEDSPDGRESNARWSIGPLPPVLGDATLLRQVLVNLMGNALKFSRHRDRALIELDAREDAESDRVEICCRDNGVGYDPQYKGKLFRVFQRLHTRNEFEGTGIGLAIVQRVIERHGGTVRTTATPGEGASFCFTLNPAREG